MAKKLSTTRKGFAIGLAVVGIAGLSLASAATLGFGPSATLQAGTQDLTGCQGTSPVTVRFTNSYVADADSATTGGQPGYKVDSVVFSGINVTPTTGCVGKHLKFNLLNSSGAIVGSEADITIATATATQVIALPTAIPASVVSAVAAVIAD